MKRLLAVVTALLFALILLPSAGLAQSKQEGIRLFNEAKALQDKARTKEDLERAVEKYDGALRIFEKIGDVGKEVVTLHNLGWAFHLLGQYPKAIQHYETALGIERKRGMVKAEGQTLLSRGDVYRETGQHAKAMEYGQKSLEISRKIGDVKLRGMALNNLGNVHRQWQQYPKAVELYEKSLAISKKIRDTKTEGQALNNLGKVYSDWGQYAKAVEYYEEALKIFGKIGDVQGQGQALTCLGTVHGNMGQHTRAAEYFEKALEISRKIGDVQLEAAALGNLGLVHSYRDDHQKALASFLQELEIYMKIGLPVDGAKAKIGLLYLDMGDVGKAEPFITEAGQSGALGRLSLLKSEYGTAREYYEKLLKSAEHTRNAADLFTSYTGLGMATEGLENNLSAADYFRKAVDLTEALLADLSPSERAEFYNVRVAGFYRTAPYEGLARVLVKLNRPVDALRESEYTKAHMLAESWRSEGSTTQAPKSVMEKDSQLNGQLAALAKNLRKAYEKDDKEMIALLDPQVNQAKAKLAAHLNVLRKQYPIFAATKYAQPMALDQTALKEKEWVLAYHVTDSGLIIYLTKGKNLVNALLRPIPRKDLYELVHKFRKPMELGPKDSFIQKLSQFDFSSGRQLADLLLGDILPELPRNAPVIVIPDGSLGAIPFEMLILNDGGKVMKDKLKAWTSGVEFFGDRNPISYYQSITTLTLARTLKNQQKPGDRILVIADPIFSWDDPRAKKLEKKRRWQLQKKLPLNLEKLMGITTEMNDFPRLRLTGQLGESLRRADPAKTDLYTGMQAQKSRLLQTDPSKYSAIVIATHSYSGKHLPGIREPVLILTLIDQPKGQDGFMRASEVLGLRLHSDLVALVASDSLRIGNCFLEAGAKSVLASLWSVAETASVNLTESFFKHLKEGKSKLDALRLARDEIRKAGYDHPFFWAPFILVGEVN